MTRATGDCPSCGKPFSVAATQITVVRTPHAYGWRLVCPSCHDVIEAADTNPAQIADLTLAGARIVDEPLREDSMGHRSTGPAFTPDDVLAFHELLADDEALWADLEAAAQ